MFKKNSLMVLLALSSGALIFAFYNDWIIFNVPFFYTSQVVLMNVGSVSKKKVPFWYWVAPTLKRDDQEVLWSSDSAEAMQSVTARWLTLLSEEALVHKKVSLQMAAKGVHDSEFFLSFDRSFLSKTASTFDKLMLLESLLKTWRETAIPLHNIRFFIHHQQFFDMHLDFSRPWPVDGFVVSAGSGEQITSAMPKYFDAQDKKITIMLDPAGDAQYTGRAIDTTFERGLTLQWAQELKYELERRMPLVRVLLTRVPGEVVEPLQNAAFANRLGVDLYVHLSFYQEHEEVSRLFLYYVMYNSITDLWSQKQDELNFELYNLAYKKYFLTSREYVAQLAKSLKAFERTAFFAVQQPFGIPYKPLVGIQIPACGVECGIKKVDDWHKYIEPITQAIMQLNFV